MAALLQSESRRLYSWWWDSHISPKNSKWLQENLTDMDSKVKAMIKLIEEDADSFARRAEMYYKKRPELIKLVEEFYRAYRALAERYDHATGELRQAQRTMAEAFPNHIPLALSEDSPSCTYEAGPHTPEMPHPIRSLLDSDDFPIGSFGLSCNFHTFEESDLNTGQKGLKQLSELFGEGRVRKGLNFQDGEKNDSNLKSEQKDEEEKDKKIRDLQEALSKLSGENHNLSSQILAETKRADTAQTEVGKLHESIGILKAENEASLCQYHQSLEVICKLERDISQAIEDMKCLNSEILEKDTKVKDAEERCDFLEKTNQSLQLDVESLAKKLEMQEKVILERQDEVEKLHTCMREKQLQLSESNAALQSLWHMQAEYEEEQRVMALKLQDGIEKLEERDSAKNILEEEVAQLKAERQSSNKQKISLCLLVQNLHEQISDSEDAKRVLEEKLRLLLDKQSASLQELFCMKGEIQNLYGKHQNLIEQIVSVGLNVDNIHSSVKELQDENVQLKDICLRENDEKSILLGKLGDMEKLVETNLLLKNSLSDANVELEGLRKKVTHLDQTIQAIQEEKSCILAEKIMLVSQVETILNNTEKLSKQNGDLENQLSDMSMEFSSLDIKSRNLEESCLSLQDANSNLLMERKTMVSMIASIQSSLEDLNRRVSELETKHSCMENEKKLALHLLIELEVLLNQEKEAHETFVRLNESRMANLENQIRHLQEAAHLNKKEIEEEQENVFTAHIEIFMLQSCIAEIRENNFWLKDENQKCIEELKDEQKLLYEMKQENCEQKKILKLLLDNNMKLRTDICQLLSSLDTEAGGIHEHQIEDNLSLHQILQTSEQLHNSLLYAEEKVLQLNFERSVNTSLLQQITLEAADLVAEKEFLEQNFETRTEELNLLESEKHQLVEMNKQLKEELDVVYCQQEILKSEMDILSGQLCEIREAYHIQSHNNSELLEENRFWKKEFCFLRDDKYILEEEYDVVLKEALALDCFSFVLKNFTSEKDSELKNLCDKFDHLVDINHDIVKEVNVVNEKLKKVDMEKWHLKESVEKLNRYKNHSIVLEDELVRVQRENEELSHGLEDGKRSLFEKETELLKFYQKFEVTERENLELDRENELLKNQLVVAKLTSENLEKKVSFLSEDKIQQNDQIMHLRQENGKLDGEVKQLQIALKEQKTQEEYLKSELQKRFLEDEMGEMELEKLYSDLQIYIATAAIYGETTYKAVGEFEKEIGKFEARGEFLESELERRFGESELWENEASSLYKDVHVSCVCAAIFKEKTYELIKRYENLEAFSRLQSKKAGNEIAARDADNEELRKKLDVVEEEKERLGCELTADLPLLLSLWDSISALEVQVLSIPMIAESCDQELQESSSTSYQHGEHIIVPSQAVSGSSRVSELCNLQAKVQAVTQALMESKRLLMLEISKINAKLAAAMKEIEELKSNSNFLAGLGYSKSHELQKDDTDEKMKDIQLDHILDSSYYENGFNPDVKDGRPSADMDDQMLELWETAERSGNSCSTKSSPDLAPVVALIQMESHQNEAEGKERFSEVMPANKQEATRGGPRPQQEGRERAMERLASDGQRLVNLQASMEALKKQIESVDRNRQLSGSAYDRLKRQLEVTEQAVFESIDMNSKLTKGAAAEGLHEMEDSSRRQISEQAQKCSQKIGRLEFEVQRIQYVLLKLEDEFDNKSRKSVERSAGFSLKEYIYGAGDGHKKEKRRFCACVRPSTKE